MSRASNPKVPIRADQRFIQKLIKSTISEKVESIPEEYNRIAYVFNRSGGSWSRLFHGSPEDIGLLKKVIKVAFDKGYLSKRHKWSSG